mmetsp:Transcript_21188/g.50250  ORF Transcript_21188/g.50250 Transcript_21188/m.50250 type:complete len:232 (+) Transcript_21188:349-1044(+)
MVSPASSPPSSAAPYSSSSAGGSLSSLSPSVPSASWPSLYSATSPQILPRPSRTVCVAPTPLPPAGWGRYASCELPGQNSWKTHDTVRQRVRCTILRSVKVFSTAVPSPWSLSCSNSPSPSVSSLGVCLCSTISWRWAISSLCLLSSSSWPRPSHSSQVSSTNSALLSQRRRKCSNSSTACRRFSPREARSSPSCRATSPSPALSLHTRPTLLALSSPGCLSRPCPTRWRW